MTQKIVITKVPKHFNQDVGFIDAHYISRVTVGNYSVTISENSKRELIQAANEYFINDKIEFEEQKIHQF